MKKILICLFVILFSLIGAYNIFAAAPTVTTNPGFNVEETTATLNGTLTNDGGETTTAWFQYGTTTAYGTVGFDGIGFTLLDTQDDTNYYNKVWGNYSYIYTTFSGATTGVHAYSFNGTGFTLLDTQDDGGSYTGVWSNDTYIYTACSADGVRAYTFIGGNFVLVDTQDDGDFYRSVWSDGTYVYTACHDDGVRAYTFIGGNFVLVDTQDDGDNYHDVWGDGTYIYAVSTDEGIRAYSFNGVTFTLLDTQDDGAFYNSVFGDGTYVYIVGDGIRAYSFDGATLSLEGTRDDGGTYFDVYVDGTSIYTACDTNGIRGYSFDGTSFTLLDTQNDGGSYSGSWINNTVAFVACFNDGIRAYNLTSFRTTGETFYTNITGLSPGTLYRYRAVANNTDGTSYGADAAFLTRPNGTTVLNVSTYSPGAFNLSWIPGDGANHTYIERNNIATWNRGDGLLRYNGTDKVFNDTLNLFMDRTYFYRAWSFTNWTYNPTIFQFSNGFAAAFNATANIDPPYNGSSSYDVNNFRLNITWTSGNSSDYDIVVQNNNSFPTTPTDGWIRQNSSSNSSNYFNGSVNYGTYFTIWSYNDSSLYYSLTGLNLPWGAIALNCYNESNPFQAIGFDIEISNSIFTVTYAATGLTNTHYIDMENIPFGYGTIFHVSNSSYETRTTTMDILQNNFYNLSFYLPIALPIDPDENITYAEDYVIHVVGLNTDYGVDPPVEDAEVIIRKYINTTEQYENVGIYITSADGTFTIPLLPGSLYSFNISATGYDSTVESWTPVEIVFSDDRHHTFRLTPSTTPVTDYTNFWDTVILTGVMNDIDGLNGTITITYSDSNSSTTNTDIYIYEHYNGTSTLIVSINNVSENNIVYTTGVINTTRLFTVVLFFNNTANFDAVSPVSIIILPINVWSERTKFDFEDRTGAIFGTLEGFTYAGIISAGLAVMALVMFGPHNTGLGILACGFVLGFTNWLFTALFTGGFNIALAVYVPVIIVIGAMYILVKNPGGHL